MPIDTSVRGRESRRRSFARLTRAVVGAAALLLVGLGARSDFALRVVLSGPGEALSSAERWVIVSQDGDCDGTLRLVSARARILGWNRPGEITFLVLGNAEIARPEGLLPVSRAGRLRASALAAMLRWRGVRSTPLLVRFRRESTGLDWMDLNEIPRRG